MNNISTPDDVSGMSAAGGLGGGGDSLSSPTSHLSQEDREKQEKEWRSELDMVEDEIATLRSVLAAKMRLSAELKRKLGITAWKEMSDELSQGVQTVKESNAYQVMETKVGQVTKAVTDAPIYQKTTSLLGGITGGITTKLTQMRHSESFKSFEEKASSAIENVKTKVVSRSTSQQSFEDGTKSRTGSIVTSPTIAEERPITN